MTSSKSRLSKTFTFAVRNVIVIKVSLKHAQKIRSYHSPLGDKTTFKEGLKRTYLIIANFRTVPQGRDRKRKRNVRHLP